MKKLWKFVIDHQAGIFRVAVLSMLLYACSMLQKIYNELPSTSGVEGEVSQLQSNVQDMSQEIAKLRTVLLFR